MKRISDYFRSDKDLHSSQKKTKIENTDTGKHTVNVFDTLDACCGIIFPTIKSLISILASLPISTASAERSFSTLRRLKTWLRSRMGEHRLTGLALLHTHKDIIVNIEEVINRFANEKKRNVQLLL
ncbi:zinc finger MYM-type protein 1-like [Acyrthosiphon pisum]|uniref:HAT C-terminal dimerisation domain-containing protein n=1 Tax=Acyrthosiphon pisum TaxID=7029 RepID=A0A8R2JX46_ACYPI|nr:zinc finger MYM-type protein 1-like [Acyrthosiphon pisum]